MRHACSLLFFSRSSLSRSLSWRSSIAALAVSIALASLLGCGSTTTSCQSGPKYGTQCYNSSQQLTYSSPPSAGPAPAPYQPPATPAPTAPQR